MSDRDTGDLPYELGRDKIVLRVRASPRVVITGDPAKAAGAINSLVQARQED